MYVSAVGNDTVLVDVREHPRGVGPDDRRRSRTTARRRTTSTRTRKDVEISHQSDVTSDGNLLVVTDERGGGTGETRCNTEPNGVIGGMHFWALDRLSGVPPPSARRRRARGGSAAGSTRTRPSSPTCSTTQLATMGRLGTRVHDPRLPTRRQRDDVARLDPGRASTACRACPAARPSRRTTARASGTSTSRERGATSTASSSRPHDVGQHARLERHARRRDVVGEGVQGLHLRGRHGARLRRVRLRRLRGRPVRRSRPWTCAGSGAAISTATGSSTSSRTSGAGSSTIRTRTATASATATRTPTQTATTTRTRTTPPTAARRTPTATARTTRTRTTDLSAGCGRDPGFPERDRISPPIPDGLRSGAWVDEEI